MMALNCFYHPLVHLDAILVDDVTKEVYGVMVELALFELVETLMKQWRNPQEHLVHESLEYGG